MVLVPTPETLYLGIDPGKKGGLAIIGNSNTDLVYMPMPGTERDLWNFMGIYVGDGSNIRAVIEKVHSMPSQSAQSGFTFGRGYGSVRMAMIAKKVSFDEIDPRAWMKALKIPPRKAGLNQDQWKQVLRGIAQQWYPNLPIWEERGSKGRQLAVADAILLATYCKRKHEGTL